MNLVKSKFLAFLCVLSLFLSGCGSNSGLTSAYNMTRCEYDYNSISKLSLAGVNLSNGVSPLQIPKILALLTTAQTSIPLDATVNLNVKNTNTSQAALNGLEYIVNVDGFPLTTGKVSQPMTIAAGQTKILPLTLGVDLVTLLKGDSRSAVENMVKNAIGMGNSETKMTIQIKPTFLVGGIPITSPVYIPVSFSFGG